MYGDLEGVPDLQEDGQHVGREGAHVLHQLQHVQRVVHGVALGGLRLHQLRGQVRGQALQALGQAREQAARVPHALGAHGLHPLQTASPCQQRLVMSEKWVLPGTEGATLFRMASLSRCHLTEVPQMNLQLKSMPEGRVHLNYSWAESTLQEHLLGKGRLHGVHRGKIAHVATMRTHGLQRAQHVQAL